jgi:hypothetical protein
MNKTNILYFIIFFHLLLPSYGLGQLKTVHVFVALCDNEYQGIVPVPERLGNGEDADNNLYWGALYGIRTFFRNCQDWDLIETIQNSDSVIIERCIFQHHSQRVYLIADAYKGQEIKDTTLDFLQAASGAGKDSILLDIQSDTIYLPLSGQSDLIAYIGHNGLMDFRLNSYPQNFNTHKPEVIILACLSRDYFSAPLLHMGARPLLLTTGLMAPEAYTLEGALKGWIRQESKENIRLRAGRAYHEYQKCGLRAATNLFSYRLRDR